MAIVFQFRDVSDELKKALDSANKKGSLSAGLHNVVIDEVAEPESWDKDPTWVKLKVVYRGVGDRTKSDFLFIPTVNLTYNGKYTLLMKLSKWLSAFGVTLNATNYEKVLESFFGGDLSKLIGLRMAIRIGYTANHAKKTDDGIVLVDVNDQPIAGHPVFSDYNEVKTYCSFNSIKYQDFPDILEYKYTGESVEQVAEIMGTSNVAVEY